MSIGHMWNGLGVIYHGVHPLATKHVMGKEMKLKLCLTTAIAYYLALN
jgi:hypothetical protein